MRAYGHTPLHLPIRPCVILKVTVRLRNWPVRGGTEGAGPYIMGQPQGVAPTVSTLFFVIFVPFLRALRGEKKQGSGFGVGGASLTCIMYRESCINKICN